MSVAHRAGRPAAVPHRLLDDVVAMTAGTLIVGLGLAILRAGQVVTGGTAGVALILSQVVPWPMGLLFLVVNLPFFVLAIRGKGWSFAVRSGVAIGLVSVFASVETSLLDPVGVHPVAAVVIGNVLSAVGVLILFRHNASLGGFNIVALTLQERLGWRAGYVLMVLDSLVILASLTLFPPWIVALSAVGAVVLNLILALNHRPGRYFGS